LRIRPRNSSFLEDFNIQTYHHSIFRGDIQHQTCLVFHF
jgi:hypothetical protein